METGKERKAIKIKGMGKSRTISRERNYEWISKEVDVKNEEELYIYIIQDDFMEK